jgi:hypothetical protein
MSRLGGNGRVHKEHDCVSADLPACSRLMLLERDLGALVAEWRAKTDELNDNIAALQAEVARMGDAGAEHQPGTARQS